MQHKRKRSHILGLAGALTAAVIIVAGALMMRDIPAKQQPVEKELDAKAFLGASQQ